MVAAYDSSLKRDCYILTHLSSCTHMCVIIYVYMFYPSIVISKPDDVTVCEGDRAVFTCLLNSNIRSDEVQWYRFIKDTSTTVMVDPDGDNINFITDTITIGSKTNSSLTITNVTKSYTGHFWIKTSDSSFICSTSLTVKTSMYINKDNKIHVKA